MYCCDDARFVNKICFLLDPGKYCITKTISFSFLLPLARVGMMECCCCCDFYYYDYYYFLVVISFHVNVMNNYMWNRIVKSILSSPASIKVWQKFIHYEKHYDIFCAIETKLHLVSGNGKLWQKVIIWFLFEVCHFSA